MSLFTYVGCQLLIARSQAALFKAVEYPGISIATGQGNAGGHKVTSLHSLPIVYAGTDAFLVSLLVSIKIVVSHNLNSLRACGCSTRSRLNTHVS